MPKALVAIFPSSFSSQKLKMPRYTLPRKSAYHFCLLHLQLLMVIFPNFLWKGEGSKEKSDMHQLIAQKWQWCVSFWNQHGTDSHAIFKDTWITFLPHCQTRHWNSAVLTTYIRNQSALFLVAAECCWFVWGKDSIWYNVEWICKMATNANWWGHRKTKLLALIS